jgi:hypothetical protein
MEHGGSLYAALSLGQALEPIEHDARTSVRNDVVAGFPIRHADLPTDNDLDRCTRLCPRHPLRTSHCYCDTSKHHPSDDQTAACNRNSFPADG